MREERDAWRHNNALGLLRSYKLCLKSTGTPVRFRAFRGSLSSNQHGETFRRNNKKFSAIFHRLLNFHKPPFPAPVVFPPRICLRLFLQNRERLQRRQNCNRPESSSSRLYHIWDDHGANGRVHGYFFMDLCNCFSVLDLSIVRLSSFFSHRHCTDWIMQRRYPHYQSYASQRVFRVVWERLVSARENSITSGKTGKYR